jgi:hypothetical protein
LFFLCLVYPMLPVSLDFPFLFVPSVFSNIYILSSDVILMFACLLFLCYLYVSIFGEKLYRAYMFCICKIYRIKIKLLYFVFRICFSGLSFFLPFRYSLTCICPVSCVPYVASFSGFSIFVCPFGIL